MSKDTPPSMTGEEERVLRGFKIVPGPPNDDGRWKYAFTTAGVFAAHPDHPARFLEFGSDWWKIVRTVEDGDHIPTGEER